MKEQNHDQAASENVHCIWMDAGVVAYKLCDTGLDCDRCAFHHGMLQHARDSCSDGMTSGPEVPARPRGDYPTQDSLDAVVERLLGPIRETSYPADRRYSLHRLWVAPAEDGTFSIGVDHVVPPLVSPIHGVVLPRQQTRLYREMPFAWLLTNTGILPLPAPMNGLVIDSNEHLSDHPEWITRSPYDEAWIIRATTDSPKHLEQLLLPAETVKQNNLHQMEMMQSWIRRHVTSQTLQDATLCDGGLFVQSLHELLGQKYYPRFLREFLSFPLH